MKGSERPPREDYKNNHKKFNWRLELERLQSLYDSTVAATKERSRAVTLNLSVASHDKLIRDNLSRLHRGVQLLEINLSKEEEHGGVSQPELKEWEKEILDLSKNVDRLNQQIENNDEVESNTKHRDQLLKGDPSSITTSRPTNPPSIETDETLALHTPELLQVHARIIEDQDRHLDHLSEAIGRQKELGILISDELDLHAELLEQNEIAVDSTAGRMGTARRRLEDFRKSASSKTSTLIICTLVLVLIAVLALSKLLKR